LSSYCELTKLTKSYCELTNSRTVAKGTSCSFPEQHQFCVFAYIEAQVAVHVFFIVFFHHVRTALRICQMLPARDQLDTLLQHCRLASGAPTRCFPANVRNGRCCPSHDFQTTSEKQILTIVLQSSPGRLALICRNHHRKTHSTVSTTQPWAAIYFYYIRMFKTNCDLFTLVLS